MGEGGPELTSIGHWGPDNSEKKQILDAKTLVAGLNSTWQMVFDCLIRWTPSDLGKIFPTPDDVREEEREYFPLLVESGSSGMFLNMRFTTAERSH
jgi:hypothetical protein